MSVSIKDRFLMATSAAAILVAAAGVAVRAQSLTPAQDLGLRGSEPVLSQNQVSPAAGEDTGAVTNGEGDGAAAMPSDMSPQDDTSDVINYGRPKQKKPVLYQLPVVPPPKPPFGYPPLPPLTPYKTAPGTIRKGGGPPLTAPVQPPPPTVAVLPSLPYPPKLKREDKPYDPLGIDVGSLRLLPYGEIDTGYDSNPNQLPAPVVGSSFVHGETGLNLQSQWSQNSLGVNLRAGYYEFQQVPAANRPDVNATVNGRVDVTKTTKINLETRFGLQTQQPGSPLIAIPGSVFITNRPLIANVGQTVGASQQFNRLTLDLRGSIDRYMFGDAEQSNGVPLLLSLANYNDYALTGRASYELNPGLVPFIQVAGDARRYDSYFDLYGFARNSDGVAARIGTRINFTRLLAGEISAGYAFRDYVDPRLPQLTAPTLDGSLVYTATPLTTLTLTAATDLSETTFAFAAGAVTHRFTGLISHALLRNLLITGTASYQINQYVGTQTVEQLYSFGAGAEYSLTRSIVIRGSFTHSRLGSNLAGDDYTENVFLVGLKLQR